MPLSTWLNPRPFFADFLPEPARRPVRRIHFEQRRILLLALLTREVATRQEWAHVRQVNQVGRKTPDRVELRLVRRVEAGDRVQQADRVWVTRVGEQLLGR